MHIEITIHNANESDKEKLRELAAHFIKNGEVVVRKEINPEKQKWSFPRVRALRALKVSFDYNITILYSNCNFNVTPMVKSDVKELNDKVKELNHKAMLKECVAPKKFRDFVIDDNAPHSLTKVESDEENEAIDFSTTQQPCMEKDKKSGGRRWFKPRQSQLWKPTEEARVDVQKFIDKWNSVLFINKLTGTDRQCREIAKALKRPYFAEHYEKALREVVRSPFLKGLRKGFKFTIDWFLVNDNFDKILEGKYRDSKPNLTQNKSYDVTEL